MFRRIYEQCSRQYRHYEHKHWDRLDRIICEGRNFTALSEWERIKSQDAFGIEFPKKHKHHYRVKNKVLITPQGMPVDMRNVYWQCIDSNCWHIFSMPREEVKKELTRKKVEQSWPA